MPVIMPDGMPATVADLIARWRPLSTQETANAEAYLVDAWEILLVEVPDLEDRLTEGLLSPNVAVSVLCAMVLRKLQNLEGKSQESIDDYAFGRAGAVADGMLYATSAEIARLSGSAAASAFSITPWQAS